MFVVTFSGFRSLSPLRTKARRVGRQKLKLVEEAMRRAWDKVTFIATVYNADITQQNSIKTCALNYTGQ